MGYLTLKFNSSLLKIAKNVQISIQDVLQMSFKKVGSNCGIFKQALENRPSEFHSICGSKDLATNVC